MFGHSSLWGAFRSPLCGGFVCFFMGLLAKLTELYLFERCECKQLVSSTMGWQETQRDHILENICGSWKPIPSAVYWSWREWAVSAGHRKTAKSLGRLSPNLNRTILNELSHKQSEQIKQGDKPCCASLRLHVTLESHDCTQPILSFCGIFTLLVCAIVPWSVNRTNSGMPQRKHHIELWRHNVWKNVKWSY